MLGGVLCRMCGRYRDRGRPVLHKDKRPGFQRGKVEAVESVQLAQHSAPHTMLHFPAPRREQGAGTSERLPEPNIGGRIKREKHRAVQKGKGGTSHTQ